MRLNQTSNAFATSTLTAAVLGVVLTVCASSSAHAQDLLVFDRTRNFQRIDLSDMSRTVQEIVGLPAEDMVLGAGRVHSIFTPSITFPVVFVAEDLWGTQARYVPLEIAGDQASTTSTISIPLNGGVAFAVSELSQAGLLPSPARSAVIDVDGNLYTSSAPRGPVTVFWSLPDDFPGRIVGSAVHGAALYLMKEGTGVAVGQRVLYQVNDPGPAIGQPVVTASWPVSITGSQILGIEISDTNELYALVNRPISCIGHGHGEIVLMRSTTSLSATSLALAQIGPAVSTWFNGGVGCLEFPPVYLLFEDAPPADVALAGPTTTTGCAAVTLTASWGSGPQSGTIEPGGLIVENGDSVSVVPAPGGTVYTLHVTGLTGIEGTASLSVSRDELAFTAGGEPTGTASPACPGTSPSFTARCQNFRVPVTYDWIARDTGVSVFSETKSSAATAGSSIWTVNSVSSANAGDYRVEITSCGERIVSSDFTVDVGEPAAVLEEPASSVAACAGTSFDLRFRIAGHPAPSYELHRLVLGGTVVERSGTTSAGPLNLTLPAITATNFYRLDLVNSCGSDSSATIQVDVLMPPSLTTSLQASTTTCEGLVSLSVVAVGDPPLSFAWTRDGIAIPGASGSTYTLAAAMVADSGRYEVVVTNPAASVCGSASSETMLAVVGTPQVIGIDLGSDPSGVFFDWVSASGAEAYRVYRSDAADGTGKTVLADWMQGTGFYDTTGIPGHSYYYSVVAATDAGGGNACAESVPLEGWRALTPPVLSIAYTFPQSYAVGSWNAPAGSGFYKVYRREAGDPMSETPVTGWISGMSAQLTGESLRTYEFSVRAAVDASGTHASEPSALVSQRMPCQDASLECGDANGPGLLILIDRSMHMLEPAVTGTRWTDAVLFAQQEASAFFSQCPDGTVAIWTFAGDCIENLTSGFVDQTHAEIVLASLPPAPSATLGAPLAMSLCQAIFNLCGCVPVGSSCTIPTGSGPREKIVMVLTTGRNEGGSGPCIGVDATAGSSCSANPFLPTSSWQARVCNLLGGTCPSIYALVWSTPFSDDIDGSTSMAAFAERTGGVARTVFDGDPLPDPFFGDCNGNGSADALDISSGISQDCDADGVPDECQAHLDCNGNGSPDACDLAAGSSLDLNGNGAPDECEGLALTGPVLPLADLVNDLHLVGGTPGGVARLLAVLPADGAQAPSPRGGAHALIDPAQDVALLLMQAPLDANGHARFQIDVPPDLLGITVLFRAWEVRPTYRHTETVPVTFQ